MLVALVVSLSDKSKVRGDYMERWFSLVFDQADDGEWYCRDSYISTIYWFWGVWGYSYHCRDKGVRREYIYEEVIYQSANERQNRRINFIRKRNCYYKSKGICWWRSRNNWYILYEFFFRRKTPWISG